MNDPRDQRRSRLVTAFAAAAGLLVAAAVAVPAAGATAGHAQDGAASARATSPTASRTKTKKAKTRTTKGTTVLTTTRTTSSRPHCTGCVEHAVFGFEDGTTQRWLPYGRASAEVNKGVFGSLTSLGPVSGSAMPRTGRQQLTVSGMGNAAGLRWPGTSDTILASFQARVWVRTRARTGTLTLRISNSYASVSASAVVGPQGWTAITTPSFFGNHQTATISLTQENYCADGDLGMFDLDDTAIASSFTNDPPVWRADDTSLLNAALPQITLSMLPCPSSTSPTPTPSSEPTVLDFEDGTTQGWRSVGQGTVKSSAQAALEGSRGLRIEARGGSAPGARLVTPTSDWGGTGSWYQLSMLVAAAPSPTATPTTITRTCAPPIVITPTSAPAAVQVKVGGATQIVGERTLVGTAATRVTVWFQLPEAKKKVSVALKVSASWASLDDVELSRVAAPATDTTTPTTTSTSGTSTGGTSTGSGASGGTADGVLPLC